MRRGRATLPSIHISRTAARWISVTGSAKGSSSITMRSAFFPERATRAPPPPRWTTPRSRCRSPAPGTGSGAPREAGTAPCPSCHQGLREPAGQSDEPTIIPPGVCDPQENLSRVLPRGELAAVTGDEPLVQPRETRLRSQGESQAQRALHLVLSRKLEVVDAVSSAATASPAGRLS